MCVSLPTAIAPLWSLREGAPLASIFLSSEAILKLIPSGRNPGYQSDRRLLPLPKSPTDVDIHPIAKLGWRLPEVQVISPLAME